jgi:hypothetical protein
MKHAAVSAASRGRALTLGSERINRMTPKKQLGVPTVEFAPVALSALDLDRHNRHGPAPS